MWGKIFPATDNAPQANGCSQNNALRPVALIDVTLPSGIVVERQGLSAAYMPGQVDLEMDTRLANHDESTKFLASVPAKGGQRNGRCCRRPDTNFATRTTTSWRPNLAGLLDK